MTATVPVQALDEPPPLEERPPVDPHAGLHDDDAERDVLAAALIAGPTSTLVDDCAAIGVTPDAWYRPAHAAIWRAVTALAAAREPHTATAVAARLAETGDLARIGGAPYLADLVARNVPPAAAAHYARIVVDRAARYRLWQASLRVAQLATAPGSVDDAIAAAQAATAAVADGRYGTAGADTMPDDVDALVDVLQHGGAPAMPTGIPDVDRILNGGLRPGTMTVLGARTSVGKTAIALDIALRVAIPAQARKDPTRIDPATMRPVGFTELEMGRDELLRRAVANLGSVDYGRLLRSPREPLSESEWHAVSRATALLRTSRLLLTDRPSATVAQIAADIRRMIRRHGDCALWVVDYASLVTPADTRVPRQEQVAAIFRGLKLTARTTGTRLLVLQQLNRGPEQSNRAPRMSDLRESGSAEQDADHVLLAHRDLDDAPDVMALGVPKNRYGPTGDLVLTFEGSYQRVTEKRWRPADVLNDPPPHRRR